ncbi:MAG: branched-chain amino acid ABC transporter substrate-binding protein [Betaproteobacteria bacterium RIFCSPLOWO2_02_FULL_65_24]|nr:MAG: branched-chain amino acid ABC transporter substrate-binding protein [Betaproteobacteria bacterium RIFCSPLOWO2_02_FULL_65_24]
MKAKRFIGGSALASLLAVAATPVMLANAQTVKIGLISTYSGPNAQYGENMDRGLKLYMKHNADKLPPGVKVELVVRDDGGPSPDVAKRLAQELIVRDKVNILAGFVWTPNAMAVAPLITEAKIPTVILNAASSQITTRSPYFVRFSFTEWQMSYPLGQWAAKRYKRAYQIVSDYAPGFDAEEAFAKGFSEGGGQVIGKVRVALASQDFTPFMQRARDVKPDIVFGFVPAGKLSVQLMKAFTDLGMDKAGIKLIGSGNLTTDEELQGMGEVALGKMTTYHYSAAATRAANKTFQSLHTKEYGDKVVANFVTVTAWDAMDAIYAAIRAQRGKVDPDRTIELLRNYKNPNSPRGPISIDPETRDIVQNIYVREVRRAGKQLANVELEVIPNVKDPWKQFNPKKK